LHIESSPKENPALISVLNPKPRANSIERTITQMISERQNADDPILPFALFLINSIFYSVKGGKN
jgi:hypothetical protein